MSKKRGLLADLGLAMNGLSHAHLGDYLPDREKKALLGVPKPVRLSFRLPGGELASAPGQAGSATSPRRVALAIQGQVEPQALRYARNACERMDADLDLLTNLEPGPVEAAIDPQTHDLVQAGCRVEMVRLGRDLLGGILDYASVRRGLLFVVVSGEDEMALEVVSRSTSERHLAVPWVVVTGASPARAAG